MSPFDRRQYSPDVALKDLPIRTYRSGPPHAAPRKAHRVEEALRHDDVLRRERRVLRVLEGREDPRVELRRHEDLGLGRQHARIPGLGARRIPVIIIIIIIIIINLSGGKGTIIISILFPGFAKHH